MHHHFYFTNPPIAPDGREGYLLSYRTGYPNLFALDLASGELWQLTARVDINPFSPVRCPTAPWLAFSARDTVWQLDLASGEERPLARFPGARLGNCSCDPAGTTLAVGVRRPTGGELALIDAASGAVTIAVQAPEVGHIQFCPGAPHLVEFSGTGQRRIWLHDRRTGTTRQVYDQPPDAWIVHETWLGARPEIVFPRWPHALYRIGADGTGLRQICALNAWHICAHPAGRYLAADTNHPDRGLVLIDTETGAWRVLCQPRASCRGTQWPTGVPAQGAGIDVSIIRGEQPELDRAPRPDDPPSTYGPQWSHPHPAWSPDGKTLVFTSDRDGWSHVYSLTVALPVA
jgi:oligogalacturonide lyase